jgi:hypothetical protein
MTLNAAGLLVEQARMVNRLLHAHADGISREDWLWRPADAENLLGFTLWHIPATQDWGMRTWLRNIEDICHQTEWRSRLAGETAAPFGMSLEEADAVAHEVSSQDVLSYADAVLDEFVRWVGGLSEEELETVPETHRHQGRHAAYRGSAYVDETEGMRDQRVWRVLAGACTGHPMRHLGEVEVLLGLRRRSAPSRF